MDKGDQGRSLSGEPGGKVPQTEHGCPERVSLCEVTDENWREALALAVHPKQQRFVADHAPIAAIALAKAYIRPGGARFFPYAIYAGATMTGFLVLAYTPGSADDYWMFHFFIDQRYQGRGYGRAALVQLTELVKSKYPKCRTLKLVVHPENHAAHHLYRGAGFRPTGELRWGEPVFQLGLGGDSRGEE
jgi:diamine N-acetyltransferase